MRKTTSLITISLAATLVFGLVGILTGCGENRAQTEVAGPIEPAIEEPVATLEESRESLEARERAMAERELALAARERALAERQAVMESTVREPVFEPSSESESVPVRPRRLPAPEPVPEPEPVGRTVLVSLPASTGIEIALMDDVSSESSMIGDPVRATVTGDIVRDGLLVVPAGSEVVGEVTDVQAQKKIGGQARLAVRFERLGLPSGDEIPIRATFGSEGKRQTQKDAATIGGSAAGGAVLGRVVGGKDRDKATLIGAIVGAAVGTAVASNNKGDPVVLEAGTTAELVLDEAVQIAVWDPRPATWAQNR